MILFCIITAFLNATTGIVLGVAALLRIRPGSPNVPFFLFLFTGSIWSGSYTIWLLSDHAEAALLWSKALSMGAILIPASYFHFCVRLAGLARMERWIVVGYVVAGILVVLSGTSYIVREVAPNRWFPFWPRAGVLYPVYLAFFAGYTVASWIILLVAMRKAAHTRRNQLKFALISTTIGFVGGASNFPLWFDIPIPPVGNGLAALYLIGVAYTIIGLRLLEVNYVVTKFAVYVIAALPLAFIYPIAFFGVQAVVGEGQPPLLALLLVSQIIAVLGIVLIPRIKERLDQFLERTVLKTFLTGRDKLLGLSYDVGGIQDETEMLEKCATVISSALETWAVFYVRGELDSTYRSIQASAVNDRRENPASLADDDRLLDVARFQTSALLVDEMEQKFPNDWHDVKRLQYDRKFEVVVPVRADGYFFGILVLGARRRNRLYSDSELSLLDSICLQIGLHARARQIERRANQTEKLISLGTLAAGLAHELRNPLVSIKTFAALIDEEGRDEFGATVLRDVSRIESIVENVSAFATDKKVTFSWIRIEEVIKAAVEIVRPSMIDAGIDFQLDQGPMPHIQGNHNQLTQVFINLLNNAVQAIGDRGGSLIKIALRHRIGDSMKPSMEIMVSDNGPGIAREIRDHLFEPFTTTKDTGDRANKGGMGLGLALVKRIVDGHNGVIRVDSETGIGTTFTVILPCEGSP